VVVRPGGGTGGRPIITNPSFNRPSVGINRPTINRPTTIVNRPITTITNVNNINVTAGRTVNNFLLPGAGIATFNRPFDHWHRGWYNGCWRGWYRWPSFWAGWAAGAWHGMVLGSGGWYAPTILPFPYYNPYFVAPPVVEVTVVESPAVTVAPVFNYSRPIEVPAVDEDVLDEDVAKSGEEYLATAKSEFRKGRYAEARKPLDRALKLVPGDTLLHEFRALTFFAEGKYKDAAAVLYAVLSKGPGWDWDTMAGFYPPGETYLKQLRALEAYCKDNPKKAEGYFLLGYHYLVLDDKESAASAFAIAAELEPKDKLAASLAAALIARPEEDKE
jgi:hypothetical protein